MLDIFHSCVDSINKTAAETVYKESGICATFALNEIRKKRVNTNSMHAVLPNRHMYAKRTAYISLTSHRSQTDRKSQIHSKIISCPHCTAALWIVVQGNLPIPPTVVDSSGAVCASVYILHICFYYASFGWSTRFYVLFSKPSWIRVLWQFMYLSVSVSHAFRFNNINFLAIFDDS